MSGFRIKRKFQRPPPSVPYAQSHRQSKKESEIKTSSTKTCPPKITDDSAESHCIQEKAKLPAHQHYGGLLHQLDVYDVLDHGNTFVFPHYIEVHRSLKDNVFAFVFRRPVKVIDECTWLFTCNCDPARKKYVESLPHTLQQPLQLAIQDPECLHIKAIKSSVPHYDAEHGISVQNEYTKVTLTMQEEHSHALHSSIESCFSSVSAGSSYIAVKPVGSEWSVCTYAYSKVMPPTAKLKCLNCSSQGCIHTAFLKQSMDNMTNDEADPGSLSSFKLKLETTPMMRSYYEATSQSNHKIALFSLKGDFSNPFAKLPQFNGQPYLIASSDGNCSQCGSPWLEESDITQDWIDVTGCILVYMESYKVVNDFYRMCSQCDSRKKFDGIENQVLWFGAYAVSHEVLKDYVKLFLLCNVPMHRYYLTLAQRQFASGNINFTSLVNYTKFRLAVIAMIRLLDIDYLQGYQCTLYGPTPHQVVLDGTALGLQKIFMPPLQIPMETPVLEGSRFECRNFIKRKSCRDLLKKFCTERLKPAEFQRLKKEISSDALLSIVMSYEEDGCTEQCPKDYQRLLLALSSDQGVCALVPPTEEACAILTDIANGVDPKDQPHIHMKFLQEHVPVLFDTFSNCNEVPSANLLNLVSEMVEKAKQPFYYPNGSLRPPHYLPNSMICSQDGMFPCLPELVERGRYVLDDLRPKFEDCAKAGTSVKRHSSLIPGLFTLSCVHGICYGFELMRNHESPNIAFTILKTRFQKAPSVIIYDMACKLHQYCLNRDPVFFRETKFLVDKFHWKNHKACNEGFQMERYPAYSKLNSQVAEQRNASIKPLASMLCYMEYNNFLLFLKLHMWYRNMLHIHKVYNADNFQYSFVFRAMSNIACK